MDVEVAVIGGGVMGLSTAWRLASREVETVLLERARIGHSGGSSHGPTRIHRPVYEDHRYVRMARVSLPFWRELEATPGSLLRTTGGLDSGDPAIMERVASAMREGGAPCELMDDASAIAPWCGLPGPFLYAPDIAIINAAGTIERLMVAAQEAGALVLEERPATALRLDGAHVIIETPAGTVRARHVVIAAGAWAPQLLPMVGLSAPLRVTEEHVFYIDGPPATMPLIWRGERFFYTVPAFDGSGTIKIGDHGRGAPVDPDHRVAIASPSNDSVSGWVANAIPSAGQPDGRFDACLYTSTPSEDFVIDRQGPVIVASPCSGHGFKFGPLIGETIACMVTDATTPIDITPFSLARF